MLRYILCNYSDAYILVKGTITVAAETAAEPNNANKKVIFKICVPFTNCRSRINNMQVDDARDIDVLMPIYDIIKYSDNYSKTSAILWKYCRDEPAINATNSNIVDFNADIATADSFKN